ncbi:AAA family ATPase [Pseudomonas putida]|uniref:AAA family ATPase n=1 Tax=Pseudomonas putida TaxID=303 RepID=UPI003D9768BD
MSTVSVLTSSNPARLTKQWELINGEPVKISAGEMLEGMAAHMPVASPADFVRLLPALKENQALVFGLPPEVSCKVTTQQKLADSPGEIARTKEYFKWNEGSGWMMLDYDPQEGKPPLTREGLLSALYSAAPGLRAAPMVWGVSSSSNIHNADSGEVVTGVRGQRLYVLVSSAKDIERAGAALFDRLWLAGYGRFDISSAGTLMPRTLVDKSVWQPNRLDFAAPPVCIAPLESRRPAPVAMNNDAPALDLQLAIPDLTPEENSELGRLQRCAEAESRDKAAAVRYEWLKAKFAHLPEDEQERARACLSRSLDTGALNGDFILVSADGGRVTVDQILTEGKMWHEARFHDPFEAEHLDDPRIAVVYVNADGAARLYSHAHGGKNYKLEASAPKLRFTFLNADTLAEHCVAPAYIVDGVLEEDAHGTAYGGSGSYKTFWVLRLAHSICTGAEFMGHKVLRIGPVVIVCGEGQGGISRRVKALSKHLGGFNGNLSIVTAGVDLSDDACMEAFGVELQELHPVLVIFDTFAALNGGVDENSPSDVGQCLRRVKQCCRSAGASSIIVHHSGKDTTKGARGAGNFYNDMDFVFAFKPVGLEGERRFEVTAHPATGKMKDGEPFSINAMALQIPLGIYNEDGVEVTSLVAEPFTPADVVLAEFSAKEMAIAILFKLHGDAGGEDAVVTQAAWYDAMKNAGIKSHTSVAARLVKAEIVDKLQGNEYRPRPSKKTKF